MQTTQESKSQLAKLMATENLIVEHKKVPTAYFNTKERKLVIPILKDTLTPEMYDLFVGHEVGHALNTPTEGWHDSVIDLKIPKVILNIVEDARIEKLIKRKYPGLRSSFSKAYRQLYNDNFFATEGVDLNGMNILDRLNIHFKIGAHLGIKFNEEELAIVDEMNELETFVDVIKLSVKIQALYREQKQKQKEKRQEEAHTEEWNEDTEYSSETMDFDDGEEEDEDGKEQEKQKPSEVSDEIDNEDQMESFNDDDKVESHTDDAFRKHEKQLLSEDSLDYNYGNVPENIKLENIVIPYKYIINRYKKESYYNSQVSTTTFNNFKTKSSKVVSYLVKEFELRKNADQMKRASVAKTGELNMSKIYSYKFNDDIFKRLTVVPGGKSHGLVIFLDWSGSMTNYLNATIKQLLNLVLFCKKVNIPFEVYAFSNRFYHDYYEKPKEYGIQVEYQENDVMLKTFNLLNLLSSKMNASELSYMASVLLHGSSSIYPNNPRLVDRIHGFPEWMGMQYTPLNETIFAAMKIVPMFQKQYKLQVVNTVFLTDGEGHILARKKAELGNMYNDLPFSTNGSNVAVLRHQSTGISEKIQSYSCEHFTAAALKIFKQVTKTNVIGFYLVSSREFRPNAQRLFPKTANIDDVREKFMREKNVTCTTSGYDEYYIIRAETDVDADSELEVKSNTTRGLVNAFTKYNTNKVINRVVLNRFIGMIT